VEKITAEQDFTEMPETLIIRKGKAWRGNEKRMERDSLIRAVKKQIRDCHMVQTEDHVVVGLSGGRDSVCLLSVLRELSRELGITLTAVHVHHGIRGAEADGDEAFCRRLCSAWGVPYEAVYADVPGMAAAQSISVETAGRKARYEALEAVRARRGAARIAVAHHRDDNAETVLWNLLRGAGLRGLAGMEPVNGLVIRPLLGVGRADIDAYCAGHALEFRDDSTNREDHYIRNRIRNHILPYAERELNARAAEHICRTARLAGEADAFLRRLAGRWLEEHDVPGRSREPDLGGAPTLDSEPYGSGLGRCGALAPDNKLGRCGALAHGNGLSQGRGPEPRRTELCLDAPALRQEEQIVRQYVVREACRRCGALVDLSLRHVEEVLALLDDAPGAPACRRAELPGGLRACRQYGVLMIYRESSEIETSDVGCLSIEKTDIACSGAYTAAAGEEISVEPEKNSLPGRRVAFGALIFEFSVFPYEPGKKFPLNWYTKWIDYDTIKDAFVIRTRRTGDYILLSGGVRKTVKAYMIDEKIPAGMRDRIPLVAVGNHILWIVGYRLDESVKLSEHTRQVLQIMVYGGKESGECSCLDSRGGSGQEDR